MAQAKSHPTRRSLLAAIPAVAVLPAAAGARVPPQIAAFLTALADYVERTPADSVVAFDGTMLFDYSASEAADEDMVTLTAADAAGLREMVN